MSAALPSNKQLSNYWLKYYLNPETKLCSLCGNRGMVDTQKTAISAAGVNSGKINFCICPNGLALRGSLKR